MVAPSIAFAAVVWASSAAGGAVVVLVDWGIRAAACPAARRAPARDAVGLATFFVAAFVTAFVAAGAAVVLAGLPAAVVVVFVAVFAAVFAAGVDFDAAVDLVAGDDFGAVFFAAFAVGAVFFPVDALLAVGVVFLTDFAAPVFAAVVFAGAAAFAGTDRVAGCLATAFFATGLFATVFVGTVFVATFFAAVAGFFAAVAEAFFTAPAALRVAPARPAIRPPDEKTGARQVHRALQRVARIRNVRATDKHATQIARIGVARSRLRVSAFCRHRCVPRCPPP
jgi:hypothetical protein